MGPRAGLDGWKILPPLGFDPLTPQPVVSRYTDRATRPTHLYYIFKSTNIALFFLVFRFNGITLCAI